MFWLKTGFLRKDSGREREKNPMRPRHVARFNVSSLIYSCRWNIKRVLLKYGEGWGGGGGEEGNLIRLALF